MRLPKPSQTAEFEPILFAMPRYRVAIIPLPARPALAGS